MYGVYPDTKPSQRELQSYAMSFVLDFLVFILICLLQTFGKETGDGWYLMFPLDCSLVKTVYLFLFFFTTLNVLHKDFHCSAAVFLCAHWNLDMT